MPDIISVIIALVLVIVAAVHDLREFRIPNRLIVAGNNYYSYADEGKL